MNRHIYIVTYDLKYKWARNYTGLYNVLKSFPSWMHYIANTWLICTEKNPEEICNSLRPHLSSDDNILITRMTNEYFGYLPKEAWSWIKSRRQYL